MTNEGLASTLLAALIEYERSIGDGQISDQESVEIFGAAERLAPHALLSDLYFWPDQERTIDEIVDEAIAREALFGSQGEVAVLLRAHDQYVAAISAATEPFSNYAEGIIAGLESQIADLRSGMRTS